MTDHERRKKDEDAGTFLLFGVVMLALALGLAFGVLWSLLFLSVFFIIVALVKAWPE